MSSTAKPALRPMLPADVAVLANIYRDSIDELAAEDYSDVQRRAWAATADDEEEFAAGLARKLTLVATIEGEPVAFAALEDKDFIAMLYVHPSAARQGVATVLVDALEKLAAARGAKDVRTDASDTAQPLFNKRGYIPQQRNTVLVNDEWLGNTVMKKSLSDDGPAAMTHNVDEIARKTK